MSGISNDRQDQEVLDRPANPAHLRRPESAAEYYKELGWFSRFLGRPWCPPITERDDARLCYGLPDHPTLGQVLARSPSAEARRDIAVKLGLALLDLHTAGIAHGNLSAETILIEPASQQPLLTAPFVLAGHPDVAFGESPDLRGWDSVVLRQETPPSAPLRCYDRDLSGLLGVTTTALVERVAASLSDELTELGGEETELRNDLPYGAISLPGFLVREGRRDPASRLAAFGISFAGEMVLDVGAHTGSLLFEAVKRGAKQATGIEFHPRRASWINRTAAFNGLGHRIWCWSADVTKLVLPPEWNGRFSILSFQALFGWLGANGPDALQRCLALLKPGGTLLFETNHCGGRSPEEWADRLVSVAGGLVENPVFVRKEWERYAYVARRTV